MADVKEAAKAEVWGGHSHAVIADNQAPDGLKTIDFGAGHSSSGETFCGRVITGLKSQVLLNDSVGRGYIERNWLPDIKDSIASPLASLRQSFLNGSLPRPLDQKLPCVVESRPHMMVSKPKNSLFGCTHTLNMS